MSAISSTGKARSRPRSGPDRILKLAVMLFLPLLVAAVAACDSGPTPTPTATNSAPLSTATATPTVTNSRAPYEGVPEGKPRYNTSNLPDVPEVLETKTVGELPNFVLTVQDPNRDTIVANYKGAVANLVDYSHIPCYCGCAMYQHPHTSLASCYIHNMTSDGQVVFTDHSTTCEVCQGVAAMVVNGLSNNQPLVDIRAAVFKKYKYTGTWTDTPAP